ncbi:MAG: hypothetical protein ACRYHA_23915 [Janthinobacterium lividum]
MRLPVELFVDVTQAAGLGIDAHTAVTVCLPEVTALADPPVVCFAFPGGGYCRRYYTLDLLGATGGGEAGFHCGRGWIVVACDPLGFGDSTIPDGNALDLDNIAAANHATVQAVIERLESGTLAEGFPAVRNATRLGIGQSMGGCFTIVAQGQFATFDGIASLGYSAIHTVVPTRPGSPPMQWPWISRRSPLDNPRILNQPALAAAAGPRPGTAESPATVGNPAEHPFQWAFHFDDEPASLVALDMAATAGTADPLPPWRSATVPPCGVYMVAPGAVALEAAAVTVPVLIAVGERDVVPDPWAEPHAFKSARDICVFICPQMAHMHNFAHTRGRFWQRIQDWGEGVAAQRAIRAVAV